MADNLKRKMTEKANFDITEVKKIRLQALSRQGTEVLPNRTNRVADTYATTNQRESDTDNHQDKLYLQLRREIQHQISLTEKRRTLSNVETTVNLKSSKICENRMKSRLVKSRWRSKRTPDQIASDRDRNRI